MELRVRENADGPYVIIHSNDFTEGIRFLEAGDISQIQLRGAVGRDEQVVDFKDLLHLKERLKIISFSNFNDEFTSVENVSALYELKMLEKLILQEDQKFSLDISSFETLKEFSTVYSKNILNMDKNDRLETLVVTGKFPHSDLQALSTLERLKTLHIYKSPKLNSLLGIERIKELREVKLAFDPKVGKIESVNDSSVERLIIEKCKLLTDFSSLIGNHSMEELTVDQLESLSFISGMPKLEKFNFQECKDGDLNPLLESGSLVQINFFPDRKHYSHSLNEVLVATGARRGIHV